MDFVLTNSNYSAVVARVNSLTKLNGMDRCVGVPVLGYQAIISTGSVNVGDVGLLFTAETQLDADFLKANNLYRKKELNADPEAKGYFEENGRVKAIKLKGNVSSAFFIPLSSLDYLGVDTSLLKVGDQFNVINGKEVCRKYIRKYSGQARGNKVRSPKVSRVDSKIFPEHLDTENWWKNEHKIFDSETLIITQKLHGTSARFANQSVCRELGFFERLLSKLGVNIAKREYSKLIGTRRTAREATDGLDSSNVWDYHYSLIQEKIPKNWIIYGEIIGWNGDKYIQHNYTYNLPVGQSDFYCYRIAVVNEDGYSVDLGWDAVKQWCNENGVKHVPELAKTFKCIFNVDSYLETRFFENGYFHAVPLSNPATVDEGVVIRVEGIRPYVLKAKSPTFLEHESGAIDQGLVDLEEEVNAPTV